MRHLQTQKGGGMLVSPGPASDLNKAILSGSGSKKGPYQCCRGKLIVCLYVSEAIRMALGQRIERMEQDLVDGLGRQKGSWRCHRETAGSCFQGSTSSRAYHGDVALMHKQQQLEGQYNKTRRNSWS